jgi:hypothetical protein
LRKAVDAAQEHGDAFTRLSAPVDLGVGKNMVNAIRYWGLAYKVLREQPDPDRPRLPRIVPSEFGSALLGEEGLDPYLEQDGSLWLLHWALFRPPCRIPAWWIAFNLYPRKEFREDDLSGVVLDQISALGGWPSVVAASVKKDVSCMVRTFAPRRVGHEGLDDLLDCPFRELHLLEQVPGEAHTWRLASDIRTSLPDEVLGYAVLDFASRTQGIRSVTVSTLANDPGGPGAILRVSEEHIYRAMARLAERESVLHVAEPAGLRQVLFDEDPQSIAADLLTQYFRRNVDGRRRFPESALPGKVLDLELVS